MDGLGLALGEHQMAEAASERYGIPTVEILLELGVAGWSELRRT